MDYLKFIVVVLLFGVGEINAQHGVSFSADSLFNLGNSAYSSDQFDEAIYYYEKAALLDPLSEDVAINLQLANEQLSTDIIELEPFFLATWWKNFNGLMLPGGWKILSIMVLIGILVLVYFYFFRSSSLVDKYFKIVCGALVVLFLLAVLAGNSRMNQIFNSSYAVLFGSEQSLYQGPDVVSEEVKDVTGGNKVKILDEDGDWYKVATMDSEQGWIRKEYVRMIKF